MSYYCIHILHIKVIAGCNGGIAINDYTSLSWVYPLLQVAIQAIMIVRCQKMNSITSIHYKPGFVIKHSNPT